MPRFNFALLPVDERYQALFSEIAQARFSTISDQYLLGKEALAHVTLAQFHARNEAAAIKCLEQLQISKTFELAVGDFNLRHGSAAHAGKFWAEFPVTPAANLMTAQKACTLLLTQHNIAPLTPSDNYHPHVTLARLNKEVRPDSVIEPPSKAIAFRPHLGLSTENGVFLKSLWIHNDKT